MVIFCYIMTYSISFNFSLISGLKNSLTNLLSILHCLNCKGFKTWKDSALWQIHVHTDQDCL